jgi:hypothetical protein
MKAALLPLVLLSVNPATETKAPPEALATAQASAAYNLSVEAPWDATTRSSDPGTLQLHISERKGSSLGVSVKLTELEGLTTADLDSGKPVTFRLRREAGIVTFSGRFRDGKGEGMLRYDGDAGYWSRIAAMGVQNDWDQSRYQLLALPLLDVRTDYIAALRREGALASLSAYVGMKAVGVAPEMVREVRPLVEGPLKAQDLMSFAALGVTADYARGMRTVFSSTKASELSSMRALGVTSDYVAEMRSAGARIRTAGDAQSFRALGISPAAVKRAVARGKPNPSVSDVMEMNVRY